jgi:hypothetical protein
MSRARLIGCAALTLLAAWGQASAAETVSPTAAADAAFAKAEAASVKSADQLRELAVERDQLKSQLAAMTNAAVACQSKNTRLVAFSEELLDDYRKMSLGRVLASRELFLGLERVKLENLVQDREDRIRANRCNQRLDAAPPVKPAGG